VTTLRRHAFQETKQLTISADHTTLPPCTIFTVSAKWGWAR